MSCSSASLKAGVRSLRAAPLGQSHDCGALGPIASGAALWASDRPLGR